MENSKLLICIIMNAIHHQGNCAIINNTEASYYISVPLPIHGCQRYTRVHYSLDKLDSREVKSSNMQTHVQGSKPNTHGKLLGRDLLHRTSIQRNANMHTHTHTDNHRNNHTSPFVNAIHKQLWPTTDNLHTWGIKRFIFKLKRVICQLSAHSCSKNNSAHIALI